jgi:hypothetical protein
VSCSLIEPGKEFVWDCPHLEEMSRRKKVVFGGVTLACAPGPWGW